MDVKVVRIIFRTFKQNLQGLEFLKRTKIQLIKLLTVPPYNRGHKYDHVEILTPSKYRFSIRMEDNNLIKNGVYKRKHSGMLLSGLQPEHDRYKLVFVFKIDAKQDEKLNEFINANVGKEYSLNIANFNFISKKLGLKLFIKNNNKWDCVTLAFKTLQHIGILPMDISPYGYSAYDFAHLLIDLEKTGQIEPYYSISKELFPHCYIRMLKTFYHEGCKMNDMEDIEEIE